MLSDARVALGEKVTARCLWRALASLRRMHSDRELALAGGAGRRKKGCAGLERAAAFRPRPCGDVTEVLCSVLQPRRKTY
jgi:hypothetical protein